MRQTKTQTKDLRRMGIKGEAQPNDPKKLPLRDFCMRIKPFAKFKGIEDFLEITGRPMNFWLREDHSFRNMRDSNYEKFEEFFMDYFGYVEPEYREVVDMALKKLRQGKIRPDEFLRALSKI